MPLGLAIYDQAEQQAWSADQRLLSRRQTETSEFDIDVYRYSVDDSTNAARTPQLVRQNTSSDASLPVTPEHASFSPDIVNIVTASFERRVEGGVRPTAERKGSGGKIKGTPRLPSSIPSSPSSPSRKGPRLSIVSLSKSFKRSISFGRQSSVSSMPMSPAEEIPPVPSLPLASPASVSPVRNMPPVSAEQAARAVIAARGGAKRSSPVVTQAPLPLTGSPLLNRRAAQRTPRRPKTAPEAETLKILPAVPVTVSPIQQSPLGMTVTPFINPWQSALPLTSTDDALATSPRCKSASLPPSARFDSPAVFSMPSPQPSPTPSMSPRGLGGRTSRDGEISPTTIIPPSSEAAAVEASPIAPRQRPAFGHRRASSQGSSWSQMARTRRESSFASRALKRGLWNELVWAGPGTGRGSFDQFPSTPSEDGEPFFATRRPSDYFPAQRQRRASSLPCPDELAPPARPAKHPSRMGGDEWRINWDMKRDDCLVSV